MLQIVTVFQAEVPWHGRYNESGSGGVLKGLIGITIAKNTQIINKCASIKGQLKNVKLIFRLLNRLMKNSVLCRFQ